jgi:chromate reductase, NAD(P)H dehydrogenase (quinone)
MQKILDIVAIVRSLRRDSFTRRLVRSFDRLLPATVGIEIVGIGDLPFYNQDMESSPPTAWTALRMRINRTDAVLFATPEHNRSVPGVLKNAIARDSHLALNRSRDRGSRRPTLLSRSQW